MKQTIALILLCCALLSLAACDRLQAPQPTPIPKPTIQPTPTVPVNSYSDITLWLADLPSGFEPWSSKDALFDPAQSFKGATLEANFGFMLDSRNPELILGWTMRVPDPVDRAAVDLLLSNPEGLLSTMAGDLARRVVSKSALSNLDRLGDASSGVSMTYIEGKERWTMDVAIFREDEAVVFIAMAYRENDLPPLPLSAFTYKLADRAKLLASAPTGTGTVAPAPIWAEYAPAGGRYSISVPGKPKESTASIPAFDGTNVKGHLTDFVAKQGDCEVGYSIGYFDQPAIRKSQQTPQTTLEIWRDVIVATRVGKLVETSPFTLQGYAGLDTTLEGTSKDQGQAFTLRFRTYLVKERFYYAAVLASPECYVPADADRFLYSFQLLTP